MVNIRERIHAPFGITHKEENYKKENHEKKNCENENSEDEHREERWEERNNEILAKLI